MSETTESRKPRLSRRDVGHVPAATARLQFHKDFTFDQATALVPYFAKLGVSHLYASPILKARPGSTHGYDCVDVGLVNPELGGEDALRRMSAAIHAAGLGLVVDIVPNHMGVGNDNGWWQDVLLWGPDSRYAFHFDIDWQSADPALNRKLLAPFLGAGYGETLASGDLLLAFDDARGFEARYFDNRFPIAIADYAALLDGTGHEWLGETARLFEAVAEIDDLPRNVARERDTLLAERDARLVRARESLASVTREDAAREAIERALARHAPATPEGRARLHALLERQWYRLASWRVAADEINWRRFFEVTDLAGIRVERDDVFEAMHATLFRLYRDGVIDAVRVDHVDGLADPRGYCRELHRRLDQLSTERPRSRWTRPWIVVEKILAADEDLRGDWKIDGTSGYDFMNEVGALLHDPQGAEPLAVFWSATTLRPPDFKTEQVAARRQILAENLAAEFNATARALHRVARADIDTRDIALIAIQRTLTELLVQFDVYRTYLDSRARSAADTAVIVGALRAAHETVRPSDRSVLAWFDHWLGGDATEDDAVPQTETRRQKAERRQAITRFQQLTPPLAAKSVEDTAFYRYGRLISRNEVGADPGDFALTIDEFHAKCLRRARQFPHAMIAVATHDHKRGADTRARLAVLSEMPGRWIATLQRWMVLNTTIENRVAQIENVVADALTSAVPMTPPAGLAAKAHAVAESAAMPLPEDQLMLMQTLIGAWPLALAGDIDPADEGIATAVAAFVERVAAWQVKALRETKRPSDWSMPNDTYEATCRAYLDRIMDATTSPFFREAAQFVASIAPAGALNGLVQATLHFTVPGVPDLYQGTEWWDFSLVDPDNRRPVDYAAREAALNALDAVDAAPLLATWRDGHVKQALIARLLALRASQPELFTLGDYQPLTVEGERAGNVLAFLRRNGAQRVLVVAPVHVASLLDGADRPMVAPDAWGSTEIVLPPGTASTAWTHVMTGKRRKSVSRRLKVADLLADLPFAILRDESRG